MYVVELVLKSWLKCWRMLFLWVNKKGSCSKGSDFRAIGHLSRVGFVRSHGFSTTTLFVRNIWQGSCRMSVLQETCVFNCIIPHFDWELCLVYQRSSELVDSLHGSFNDAIHRVFVWRACFQLYASRFELILKCCAEFSLAVVSSKVLNLVVGLVFNHCLELFEDIDIFL